MTITPLPESTIRLLGSAQALTTPTSLVKELVDNALDAKATSIDILISTNTIDRIEVRDNGHGIPLEDLDALGRHGYTSKLRSFEELRSIGGFSLGFRGEALASACQLGEISVTTKTEGEPAATAVRLKPLGGIASQNRASNSIGTTITVTNFLSKLPVRKQNALKEASKMLSKLKDLLQAYCLARPRVRFSLKVIKSSKGSWSYAPRPNDGIKDAVSLIIGRDTASQCIEKFLEFPENGCKDDAMEDGQAITDIHTGESSTENESHQFAINMFLPKPGADVSRIGHGQYISIDSRPVSHEKGTMKKIVTLFKSYLKDSLSDPSEKLKNPFLWMDIRCPVASYDANVEPAKDDVLFSNESLLLDSIQKSLEDVYGKRKELSKSAPTQKPTIQVDKFDLLKARVPRQQPAETPGPSPRSTTSSDPAFESLTTPNSSRAPLDRGEPQSSNVVLEVEESGDTSGKRWNVDISEDYSEEIAGLYESNRRIRLPGTPRTLGHSSQDSHDNGLNPWLIAKMNAPLSRERGDIRSSGDNLIQSSDPSPSLPMPQRSSDPLSVEPATAEQGMNEFRLPKIFRTEQMTSLQLPATQGIFRQEYGVRQASSEVEDEIFLGDNSTTPGRRNDFISARQLPSDPSTFLPMGALPAPFKSLTGVKRINKPFTTPRRSTENTTAQDGLLQTSLALSSRSRTVENPQELPEDSDLAWAMSFEHRKEDATRQRREEMRLARLRAKHQQMEEDARLYGAPEEVAKNSPHKNRYNAAIATLEAEDGISRITAPIKQPFKTSIPDGDSRAYLMKRQRSMSVRNGQPLKLSRAKSLRLPLERIPDNENLHSLMLSVPAEIVKMRKTAASLMLTDVYIQRGIVATGLVLDCPAKDEITSKVQAVFEKWKGWKGNMFEEQVEAV